MNYQPITRYDKWIVKKISGRPANIRAFLRFSYGSAVGILEDLAGTEGEDLSIAPYTEGTREELRRLYEPLIESAAADPDRFLYGYHQKMEGIGREIREDSLYAGFCEFFSLVCRIRIGFIRAKNEPWIRISTAYAELLIASSYYLTPSRYDLTRLLCGCSSDGEPLYCPAYYPYAGEIQSLAYQDWSEGKDSRTRGLDDHVAEHAARFGYTEPLSYDDLSLAQDRDGFRREQVLSVSPYICEYTWDMTLDTKHIYRMDTQALEMMEAELPLGEVAGSLDARSRTLPANGIRYDLSYPPRVPAANQLQSLTMKEVLRGDRFVLLYRLRFSGQDICGYYDLKDQFFYSQFATEEDELGQAVHTVLSLLVLYLYSAAVTPGGEKMVRDFGEHFRAAVSLEGKNRYPISVTARPLEGELMNTYKAGGGAGDPRPGGPGKTLQGTVRKLAPGELPSEENKVRAKELGFALAEDEIYEEPIL